MSNSGWRRLPGTLGSPIQGPDSAGGDEGPALVAPSYSDELTAVPEEMNYMAAGAAFNLSAVEADVQKSLGQIDGLRRELNSALTEFGLYPWLVALTIGAVAL